MRALFAALLPAAALIVGCGDDGSPAGEISDASVPVDARFLDDAARQPCSAEMDGCDELPFETICDLDRGHCVECKSSSDCASAEALGPRCEERAGTCQCDADEDCAGNANGNYCHPIVKACGCIDGDNCEDAQECELSPYLGTGIRTCRAGQ